MESDRKAAELLAMAAALGSPPVERDTMPLVIRNFANDLGVDLRLDDRRYVPSGPGKPSKAKQKARAASKRAKKARRKNRKGRS